MTYLLIFIISVFLNVFPPEEAAVSKVKVSFESASLVYENSNADLWDYSASINNWDIGKDDMVELAVGSTDKITFMVSVNNKDRSKAKGETTFNALVIDELNVDNPNTLNTYGSNPVTVSLEEMLTKQPKEVKIFVDVKEDRGNALVGSSTKFVFNFKLQYE